MKAFYVIAFAASVSSNIVNVVKRAEDCSVDACVRAHGSLARKGCIDGDINYADCICSLSDNFSMTCLNVLKVVISGKEQ